MRLLIALTGLLAGAAVAVAALLFNPLSPSPVIGGAGKNVYDWSPLEFHGAELNAIGMLGLPLPRAGKPLVEGSVATANAAIIVLRDAAGEAAGLATRLVALDEQGQILQGDLGVNAYTNIFFPNRGSMLLVGHENRWPVVRSNVMAALGQPAMEVWPVTTQNPDGSPSRLIGGSGELETIRGRYTESLRPGADNDGVLNGQIELDLAFK